MNGVIYCRVSSKEQIQGTSLETQELACREYARAKNIKILNVFVEQGESAKFADRTQLLELIDFCRDNKDKVQALLVWKVDRFARNVQDHFNVKATLAKHGVAIVSVTEPIDANPNGKLMETILAGFAEFDNELRAMRAVQGLSRRLQEGIFPWKPPLGYKTRTQKGLKKNEPDQPDQPTFGLLQRAWRLFTTGAYRKAEVRRTMSSWGVLTRRGQSISAQSLDDLLKNKYYAGILVDPWSGEEYEGKHLPMVTQQEFARVQEIIGRRSHSISRRKARPEFPLRGIVRCAHCQHHLTAGLSRGRSSRYAYYRCYNRSCSNREKSVPAATVHAEFQRFLKLVSPKPELTDKIAECVLEIREKQKESMKMQNLRSRSELSRLVLQSQELIRMRTEHLITDDEFLQQKRVFDEKRAALESVQQPDPLSPARLRAALSEVMAPLAQLGDTWGSLPQPLQQRFQQILLPSGFVYGRIGTATLGLLFRVLGSVSDGKSDDAPLAGATWNLFLQEMNGLLRIFEEAGIPKTVDGRAVSTESAS